MIILPISGQNQAVDPAEEDNIKARSLNYMFRLGKTNYNVIYLNDKPQVEIRAEETWIRKDKQGTPEEDEKIYGTYS